MLRTSLVVICILSVSLANAPPFSGLAVVVCSHELIHFNKNGLVVSTLMLPGYLFTVKQRHLNSRSYRQFAVIVIDVSCLSTESLAVVN